MAQVFRLPDIGEGLAEAEIVRWLIPVGGSVAMDQPVVEVETDKAIVEIPSPYAGVVLFHGGAEGEIVEVGELDPDHIHTPGIFVHRVIKGDRFEKRIERRTVSK